MSRHKLRPGNNPSLQSGKNELPDEGSIELLGTLSRVVFHNAENGYTVFRLRPEDGDDVDSIAVVGHMHAPEVGAFLFITGEWTVNQRFGRQVRMSTYEKRLPATIEGIKNYLASGLIKGIGQTMAARIVKRFGKDTLKILDDDPDQLLDVSGIGKKTLVRIRESWQESQGIRDLLLFLQPHGISAAYAVRMYKAYGQQALAIVRENPYRLAMDIRGIGFQTADLLARKLGFEYDHPLRAQAGALYALIKTSEEGNVYYPRETLIAYAAEQFDIPPELIDESIDHLEREERVIVEDFGDHQGVYIARMHHYETKISYYLQRIICSPKSARFTSPDEAVRTAISRLDLELAPEQVEAVRTSARAKVMVLTGGPGTGKTTILNGIIQVFKETKAKILLAAPTGRAAKRMSEASGMEARTIHRLLEYSPKEEGFAKNENNPLSCGFLVVDEASMMDVMLAYHLLKAVPAGATVVFVGDVNQLPSVGPGNVLRDFISSGVMPVVELVEVFRQAAESEIITNAHLINRGEVPRLESSRDRLSDFYFLHQHDPEKVAELVIDVVKHHIPRRFGLNPVDDVQVLTPMHKGVVGASSLNQRLQLALGQAGRAGVVRGERTFCLGDKVMQIRNNYDKDVYNGDIGRIAFLDGEERSISVDYDGRIVPYEFEELDDIVMAYAISIHKSQGSEYPAVVIPLMVQHYVMLQRNLVYTAVTRGKRLVILVGEGRALAMAVKNNHMQKRYTRLTERLKGGN
jgi:exodeoxyribonuclease V alpha subunit